MGTTTKAKDHTGTLDDVLLLEQGNPTEEEGVAAMQRLIDSGIVWHLQGSFGHAAMRLIVAGFCTAPTNRRLR